jgi:vacuolar-type H+-ATPase subunit E/Vma4
VARVRSDAATRKLLAAKVLDDLARELNVQLVWADNLADTVGVLVESEDGRRQFDNTLENRLKRMQASLRAPVHRILMGEAR